MIITKNFVLLNLPKTGSSFVRKIIKDIYDKRTSKNYFLKYGHKLKLIKPFYQEILLPHKHFKKGLVNYVDQHGIYSQIPKSFREKKIVSVVRNPYDRFLSLYGFKFWQYNSPLSKEFLMSNLPNYPDLSIDEFVDYTILVSKHAYFENINDIKIGVMSIQFIKFFFKEPDSVLENLTNEYLMDQNLFKKDMAPIFFLKQENLKEDLSIFLKKEGFTESELYYLQNHKEVNVTSYDHNKKSLMTEKVKKYVEEYEWFYIDALKINNVDYTLKNVEE